MDSKIQYKVISKIYGLLDLIYFRKYERNPRKALTDYVEIADKRILDVCTGTAANAIEIARLHPTSKVIGIDISKEMLHIAKKKIKKLSLNNVKLYDMDTTATGFRTIPLMRSS